MPFLRNMPGDKKIITALKNFGRLSSTQIAELSPVRSEPGTRRRLRDDFLPAGYVSRQIRITPNEKFPFLFEHEWFWWSQPNGEKAVGVWDGLGCFDAYKSPDKLEHDLQVIEYARALLAHMPKGYSVPKRGEFYLWEFRGGVIEDKVKVFNQPVHLEEDFFYPISDSNGVDWFGLENEKSRPGKPKSFRIRLKEGSDGVVRFDEAGREFIIQASNRDRKALGLWWYYDHDLYQRHWKQYDRTVLGRFSQWMMNDRHEADEWLMRLRQLGLPFMYFMVSTRAEMISNPFGKIWRSPKDGGYQCKCGAVLFSEDRRDLHLQSHGSSEHKIVADPVLYSILD